MVCDSYKMFVSDGLGFELQQADGPSSKGRAAGLDL